MEFYIMQTYHYYIVVNDGVHKFCRWIDNDDDGYELINIVNIYNINWTLVLSVYVCVSRKYVTKINVS